MMKVLITVLALAVPTTAMAADYKPRYGGCKTRACDKRVDRKKQRSRNHYMRRVIKPYRGWLASTRACESPTGRDSAPYNSAGDRYHGYYQFDLQSWRGAGGSGEPCKASLLEQSYRAVLWLKMAGRDAWPVCG
jgi:hypothetical protein